MGFRNPTLALRCPGPAPLPLPRPMSTRKRLRPRPPGSAVPEGLLCVSVQVDAHSCPRHLVRRGRNTPWLGIRREGCLPRTSSVSDSSQKPPVRGGPAPTPGGLVNRLSEFMGELAVTPSPSAGQGSPPRLFWGCPPPSRQGGRLSFLLRPSPVATLGVPPLEGLGPDRRWTAAGKPGDAVRRLRFGGDRPASHCPGSTSRGHPVCPIVPGSICHWRPDPQPISDQQTRLVSAS